MIATPTGGGYLLLAQRRRAVQLRRLALPRFAPGRGMVPRTDRARVRADARTAAATGCCCPTARSSPFGNAKPWGQPADTHAKAVALAAAQYDGAPSLAGAGSRAV